MSRMFSFVILTVVGLIFSRQLFSQYQFTGPNGNIYEYVITPEIPWDKANEIAQQSLLGNVMGHLVTITSQEEDEFLETTRQEVLESEGFVNFSRVEFWVGGYQLPNQLTPRNGWFWLNDEGPIPGTNTTATYANWYSDQGFGREPNDGGDGIENNQENFLAIGRYGFMGWNDEGIWLNGVLGYVIEYEAPKINQPPQITHAPVTSAKQGEEITFVMDVTDDKDQIQSIQLFFRVPGSNLFDIVMDIEPQTNNTHYEKTTFLITGMTGIVEYYIVAQDTEGLSGYSGTPENPHRIKVVDKWPVIIMPGFPGSELWDKEANELIWLNIEKALDPKDLYLLRLLLEEDGVGADTQDRCSQAVNHTCNTWRDCPPSSPISSICVTGGREVIAGDLLNIEGRYTSYKSLTQFLDQQNGYTLNQNLFLFGYDWRRDIEEIAKSLRSIITGEGKAPQTGDRVNIIAHSMGGLVVRSYLRQNPTDNRIDTVIYLGTPHLGSPKIFGVLAGYNIAIAEWKDVFINIDMQHFISQNFPSAYQVLPRYDFIEDESYSVSHRRLKNQGLINKADEFHQRLGNTNPIAKSFQINGSGLLTLREFKYGCKISKPSNGDGTVPRIGSEGYEDTRYFNVKEEHSVLPGNRAVQEKIIQILQEREDDLVDIDNDGIPEIQNTPFLAAGFWLHTLCSPANAMIVNPTGQRNGYDRDGNYYNEIPDSIYYNIDSHKYGFIPLENEYQIFIQAAGDGEFTFILEAYGQDDTLVQSLEYTNIPVIAQSQGELLLLPDSSSPILSYDVNGDGAIDFEIAPGNTPDDLSQSLYSRGDVNTDNTVDISDAISVLGYLFLGYSISCVSAGDANSDGQLDISDGIYILNFLFLGDKPKPEGRIYCTKNKF